MKILMFLCALYKYRGSEFVNDFEAMLAKKREDGTKRRKRRDIDIINDNDDIIDQLIQDMRAAAEVLIFVSASAITKMFFPT